MTHQRLEIYKELASTADHPDAIVVHQRVKKRMPTVSLDTVYRNLKLLEKQGLISIVGVSHERLRFDANMDLHHHFACVKCSKICDFQSASSTHPGFPEEAEAIGQPLSIHLEVRGVCKDCQKK